MGTLKHTRDLFQGTEHKITKSHCFICHNAMVPNKTVRGNACHQCEYRAKSVSRYQITEAESDDLLLRRMCDLQVETWNIDGVDYYKYPNGKLCKK